MKNVVSNKNIYCVVKILKLKMKSKYSPRSYNWEQVVKLGRRTTLRNCTEAMENQRRRMYAQVVLALMLDLDLIQCDDNGR